MATTRPAPDSGASEQPSKRVKRSHDESATSATPATSSPAVSLHRSIENDDSDTKAIPLDDINDDIVQSIIILLQQNRNRPQLVKDLANALGDKVQAVRDSANPCAIISSRLSSFIKRSCWSAARPCPLAKELEAVHPRRTYFYLTTCPHLPLLDSSSVVESGSQSAVVTPSLSSSSSTAEEDLDGERRRELSLSPEVDLSTPELEDGEEVDFPIPGTLHGSGHHASSNKHHQHRVARNQRSDEPPLEKDEKEFTQTADGLQRRKLTGQLLAAEPVEAPVTSSSMMATAEESHAELFGDHAGRHQLAPPTFLPHMAFMASPAMRPFTGGSVGVAGMPKQRDGEAEAWSKLDALLDWDKGAETIELDELDGLLNGF